MQIPSLFAAVPAVLNSGLRLIGVHFDGSIGAAAPEPVDAAEPASGAVDAVDLSSITPDDFSELIDRLRTAGQLSADGYRELLGVRLELDRARASHDEPVDVIGLLQAKLAEQQRSGTGDGTPEQELTKRQLQLLNSIGTAQSINALA